MALVVIIKINETIIFIQIYISRCSVRSTWRDHQCRPISVNSAKLDPTQKTGVHIPPKKALI